MSTLNIQTHRMLKRENILRTFKKSILHSSTLVLYKPIFIEKWRYSWFLWLGSLTCYMYKLYRIIICFSFITKLERLNKKTIVEFTPVNSACVTWPCVVIQWTRVKEPGMSLDRCPSQVPAGIGGPTLWTVFGSPPSVRQSQTLVIAEDLLRRFDYMYVQT